MGAGQSDLLGVADAGVTIDAGPRKAKVNLKPGDNVTCTYANKQKSASLTVVKKADP